MSTDPDAHRFSEADRTVPRRTGTFSGASGTAGADPGQRSLGELVSEVTQDLSTLMRQEIELAKAEATESAKNAGKGAGLLGGAGYSAGMAVFFLSVALWWALGTLMGLGWSALVVAVIWALVAGVLAAVGRKEVQRTQGLPRTTDSLKKIPHALRGQEEKNR
ncbi:phage holin family protein [Isoptericola sp. S6320L]|uniref:phage holin family protein n=1 Tax=Isoptericola sp. S6320L TaxID=2926411 RepID=UPI001FF6DF67|nr:phage holin family protein [Isoptericola sp. S6320L]MCK0118550.1 phage holin family protein [Isoptericola sp. S6320L]